MHIIPDHAASQLALVLDRYVILCGVTSTKRETSSYSQLALVHDRYVILCGVTASDSGRSNSPPNPEDPTPQTQKNT